MKHFLPLLLFSFICSFLYAQQANDVQRPVIHLTDSVACTEVKDQSQSPTCWVFGTNSLFESDLLKKYNLRLDLSEMFIARYAYIDKARQWLATKGKTYFKGGGQFHDVIRVINKYGMMPEEVYSGKLHGAVYHDHTRLDTAMSRLGRRLLRQGKTTLNANDLRQMNDTLDRYLGKLPTTFWYKMEQYNAKSFAKKLVHFNNDYVEVMSFADLPLYKKCLLDDKFNWAGDSLYNIPLTDLQMIVDSALAKGWSVGWEGDVTEAGFGCVSNYAALNGSTHDYEKERVENYKTEVTERDHMLHLVGTGKDDNGQKWYYLKNSWGTYCNESGYLYMSEEYFKLKTVVMMVNKAALPEMLMTKLFEVKSY